MLHGRPQEVVVRKLTGWYSFCNVSRQSFQGDDLECAKDAMQAEVDFYIAWRIQERDEKGNHTFIGMHPEVLIDLDRNEGLTDEFEDREGYPRHGDGLAERIGHDALAFRAHVRPEHESIYGPIERAVRAFDGSRYYIAPGNSCWSIFKEGGRGLDWDRWIEDHPGEEDALMYARRLALGFRTKKQAKLRRTQGLALTAMLILLFVIVFVGSYWFPNN